MVIRERVREVRRRENSRQRTVSQGKGDTHGGCGSEVDNIGTVVVTSSLSVIREGASRRSKWPAWNVEMN